MKYIFDKFFSFVAIILLLPILILISIIVYCKLGAPIFFTQQRIGKDNKIFMIIKFRTMLNPTPEKQSDAERLTKFGQLLRSTSLDELPEIWNVLRGEMSFVGPRPLLVQYLPLYSKEQARRHEVKPGITGWAQVNGRNAISWEEKFELDVWYINNRTFWLDLKILWMTVLKVFSREDINREGQATTTFFTGSENEE